MSTKVDVEGVKRLLALLAEEPEPDPMAEQLLKMYRKWCRDHGITPCSDREIHQGPASKTPPVAFSGLEIDDLIGGRPTTHHPTTRMISYRCGVPDGHQFGRLRPRRISARK